MKLYVDDNRPAPEGWVPARSAEEAKVHLLSHPVEAISFDFDLDNPECPKCQFQCGLREFGCRHDCRCHDQGKETGLHLLHWAIKHGVLPKKKPAVHSANHFGALRLQAVLDRVYGPGPAPIQPGRTAP